MKHTLISTLAFLYGILVFAQTPAWETNLSPRIANYDISVKLDTAKKTLTCKERLNWRNDSPDFITELQFHLYLNAFKNTNSTFLRSGARFGRLPDDEMGWGWVDIVKIIDEKGNDLTDRIEFIHPDDDNEDDQTVVRVALKEPIKPGASANFDIDFVSKLPRIIARTGFAGDHYYFVVQWFPKIGVYEEAGERYSVDEGKWNCHQFHSNTEFYADFGVYNVDLTVPKGFVVGASGVLQNEKDNEDGTKTVSYRAEDVIDFAWTANPDFKVIEDKWNQVDIKLMIEAEHEHNADKYISSLKNSMEYLAKHVGDYPYSTLTMIAPPIYGIGSSGMEYPTLITTVPGFTIHEGIRQIETVTVHEFVHQYFMQMVASNEQEEAWLDEGFTTYFENRIMDHYYGEKTSTTDVGGYHTGDKEDSRLRYTGMKNPRIAPCATPGWEFKFGGYGDIAYGKTGAWLEMLARMVGTTTMDNIMKTYFERWKFRHPCGTDFIDVVNEVVAKEHGDKFGDDMNWFFDQVLYGTQVCDYKLASISNRTQKEPVGVFDKDGDKEWAEEVDQASEEEDKIYESRVTIQRLGDMTMPQEILVKFDNGEEVREFWNGRSRNYELRYERPEKIVWAHIDPEQKIYMDINFNNNSITREPDKAPIHKWASKVLFWVQNVLQSMFFFF